MSGRYRVAELTDAADAMLEQAVAWYAQPAVPPAFAAHDPRVVAAALGLAGGNWTRLVAEENGAITVMNRSVWA